MTSEPLGCTALHSRFDSLLHRIFRMAAMSRDAYPVDGIHVRGAFRVSSPLKARAMFCFFLFTQLVYFERLAEPVSVPTVVILLVL